MKKYYVVQIIIDVTIVILSIAILASPLLNELSPNSLVYTLLGVYAILELLEYLFIGYSKESFYLSVSSFVCAFSGFFLKNYNSNIVLSITMIVWVIMLSIIKIMNFENIYKKKNRLFLIKLSCSSIIILIVLLCSINMYFKISDIKAMLMLIYLIYGVLEFSTDFLDYKSNTLLKE